MAGRGRGHYPWTPVSCPLPFSPLALQARAVFTEVAGPLLSQHPPFRSVPLKLTVWVRQATETTTVLVFTRRSVSFGVMALPKPLAAHHFSAQLNFGLVLTISLSAKIRDEDDPRSRCQ